MNRENLLRKCGLPNVHQTSHCFADDTHHTCCMLGAKARQYADRSGNPIGSLSASLQKNKTGLTPWCTCTASRVCSYYESKFGKEDGTHIKFINNLQTKDEKEGIRQLGLRRHLTPGVFMGKS